MAARNFIRWTYTDDKGNTFMRRADKALTDQAVVGGAAADATVTRIFPRNYRPRRWVGTDPATGYTGSVVCYELTATLLTDPTATVTVRDAAGGAHVLQFRTDTPERRGRALH